MPKHSPAHRAIKIKHLSIERIYGALGRSRTNSNWVAIHLLSKRNQCIFWVSKRIRTNIFRFKMRPSANWRYTHHIKWFLSLSTTTLQPIRLAFDLLQLTLPQITAVVFEIRFELTTFPPQTECSTKLSYTKMLCPFVLRFVASRLTPALSVIKNYRDVNICNPTTYSCQ